jgi:hypothetical protein
MRMRWLVVGFVVGAVALVAPRQAAAGGFFGFSVGIPLPFPVIPVAPAPVYAPAPPPPAYPPYAVYPAPPVFYGPPAYVPRYWGYRPYGPPYGYAWGHHGRRW